MTERPYDEDPNGLSRYIADRTEEDPEYNADTDPKAWGLMWVCGSIGFETPPY
jgi:hypothetical protein